MATACLSGALPSNKIPRLWACPSAGLPPDGGIFNEVQPRCLFKLMRLMTNQALSTLMILLCACAIASPFAQGATALSFSSALLVPSATNYPVAQLAAADFNKDSNLDLAVATREGVSALLGLGDGTFALEPRTSP